MKCTDLQTSGLLALIEDPVGGLPSFYGYRYLNRLRPQLHGSGKLRSGDALIEESDPNFQPKASVWCNKKVKRIGVGPRLR